MRVPGLGPLFGHGLMHDALDAVEDCSVDDLIRITNARRGRAFVVLTEPASAVLNVSARVQIAHLTPHRPMPTHHKKLYITLEYFHLLPWCATWNWHHIDTSHFCY